MIKKHERRTGKSIQRGKTEKTRQESQKNEEGICCKKNGNTVNQFVVIIFTTQKYLYRKKGYQIREIWYIDCWNIYNNKT